jgi:hypothetical protein
MTPSPTAGADSLRLHLIGSSGAGKTTLGRALAQPGWVIAGNDRAATEPQVWPRLTHLVVLDLPLATVLRRGLTGEPCCNGNTESLRRFFHRDGLVRYLLRHWRARHERQQRLPTDPALAHARVLRYDRSPRAAEVLAQLASSHPHRP